MTPRPLTAWWTTDAGVWNDDVARALAPVGVRPPTAADGVHVVIDAAHAPARGFDLVEDADGGLTLLCARPREAHAGLVSLAASGLDARRVPGFGTRGVVEGFYGPPWSHAARLDALDHLAARRMNTYLYAPKMDAFHRDRWREPYPDDVLAQLGDLARRAAALDLRLVVGIAPGLDMVHSDPTDAAALVAKVDQILGVVPEISLLLDDIPETFGSSRDAEAFPDGPGQAHAATSALVLTAARAASPDHPPLIVVPVDYAGTQESDYRTAFRTHAPADVELMWTGGDVVVGTIDADEARAARAALGRPLLLWDNFPVNDFDFSRVFLGPLVGRAPALTAHLEGFLANPMVQPVASRLALDTVGEFTWDPDGYEPRSAARRALEAVAGEQADLLAPIVGLLDAWPPSQDAAPRLLEVVLGDDPEAANDVWDELEAAVAALDGADTALAAELRPWTDSVSLSAALGRVLARERAGERLPEERAAAIAALRAAPAAVLRRPLLAAAGAAQARGAYEAPTTEGT